MRYSRVLLARLAYIGYLSNVDIFPVGIAYLSESLSTAQIEHDLLDLGLTGPRHEKALLIRKIREYQPDILGISMMTLGYQEHYRLLSEIKEEFPELKIVVGGAHVSTFRESVLHACTAIDYGCVLEGEETIVELCDGHKLEDIRGLLYRRNTEVGYTGNRLFKKQLDSIKFPRYEKCEFENYSANVPVVTSRGCPYSCTYCPVHLAIGRQFRARSAQSVVEEIGYWYQRGFRQFSMWDDNFTLKASRVHQICDCLEDKGYPGLSISIPNGVRGDRVDEGMLTRMFKVGFRQLSFGVESASDDVLKALKKGERVADNEQAIAAACRIGFEVNLYFIIGSPGETWNDFEKSLALADRYPVAEARFYTLIPFPGTELFEWAKSNDYLVREPEDYLNKIPHFLPDPCLSTPEMSREDRISAFKMGWKLTLKQRRRSKARQFKRLGIFRGLAAWATTSEWYHRLWKPVWLRKWIIQPLKKVMLPT